MSRLTSLCAAIEELPAKRKIASEANLIRQFAEKLKSAPDNASYVDVRWPHVSTVFSSDRFTAANEQREKARMAAQRLQQVLKAPPFSFNDNKVQGELAAICSTSDSARKRLSDLWARTVEQEYNNWQPVAEFADGLLGGQEIISALRVLQQSKSNPPSSAKSAEQVRQHIETVTNALNTLKLTGKAKAFVSQALAGRAAARDILDPEVQKFIEDARLWNVLTVKLGR